MTRPVDRIRIAVIVPTLSDLSSCRVAVNGLDVLSDEGYEKHLVSLRPGDSDIVQRVRGMGICYHEFHYGSILDTRMLWGLRNLCRRHAFHVVHTHGLRAEIYGTLGARLAGVPVVANTLHYEPSRHFALHYGTGRGRLGSWINRVCLNLYSDAIVALSEQHRQSLIGEGLRESKLVTAPFGIDVEGHASRSLRDARPEIIVGTAALLTARKNIAGLIEIAADLVDRFPNLQFEVAGEGELHSALSALIEQLELGQRFHLLGYQRDIRAFYDHIDIFALPSLSEGTPQSIMEAMAAGLPVVATRAGGTAGLVEHGVEGLLVDVGDMEAFAAALSELVADPTLRARMGAAAATRARTQFGLQAMAERFDSLYSLLLAGRVSCGRCLPQ